MVPKFNLLYFKNLLDVAFIKFFDTYGKKFAKVGDDYVLQQALSRQQIERLFTEIILEELEKIVKPYDIIKSPDWYLIIGACNPQDNFLLEFKNQEKYFPERLSRFISGSIQVKYILREKDIKIDIVKFNQVCLDVFNRFFESDFLQRKLGKKYKNVIFVTHKRLDCYSMFKVLKLLFGRANCNNLYLENFREVSSPIVAINDLIDKYVTNKVAVNRDRRFKEMISEVKQFITLSMRGRQNEQ